LEKDSYTVFGLFEKKNFLDREICERIRMEMSSAKGLPAYFVKTNEPMLDENVRRTVEKEVSKETTELISHRLTGIMGELEDYFKTPLSRPQEPRFLYYTKGGFFKRHVDKGMNPQNPQEVKDRKVSAIVFLNDESDTPGDDCYTGGSFIIYGILNIPRFESHGFKVSGTAGMLIAFRSELIHEVTPVTSGVRYTVADWFS
jgi:SM-20-related protein